MTAAIVALLVAILVVAVLTLRHMNWIRNVGVHTISKDRAHRNRLTQRVQELEADNARLKTETERLTLRERKLLADRREARDACAKDWESDIGIYRSWVND